MNFFLTLCLAACASIVAGEIVVTKTTVQEQVPVQWVTQTSQTSQPAGQVTLQVNGGSTSTGTLGSATENTAAGGQGQEHTENTETNTATSSCLKLNSPCNAVAAVNVFAKDQCCEGLHCELGLFEGILWPTFTCTNLKHTLGMS